MITIDGNSLSIDNVYDVSTKNEEISLPNTPEFKKTMADSRKFLEDYIAQGYPTYGVTTGFGDSCANQINYTRAEELQRAIVSFHGVGVGNKFDHDTGRAIVLARVNSDIKGGHSAIREELAEFMVMLLNKDIIPVIPEIGSVGASGDLTPLSYLAAVVMGERDVYYKGQCVPTMEAFKKEGITPLPLKAKEGLAIMNGTSVMTAVASLAMYKARRLANISDFLTAITSEIVRGNDVPFRHQIHEYKGHQGEKDSAEYIYKIVSQSPRVYNYEDLLKDMGSIGDKSFMHRDIKIQDRYSIRCAPQVNGVVRDTLKVAIQWIEEELNSSNDNPLVDIDSKSLFNTGNFYGGHTCAACDYMRTALANLSDLADKQTEIIVDGKFNGLTENLIPTPTGDDDPTRGLRFGFKAAQICVSALSAEIQFMAQPMSIHSRPTEALNQDKVSMGTISARKLAEQVKLVYLQLAIQTLASCQAMDIAGVENFSPFSQKLYSEVRKISAMVTDDRALDKDVNKIADFLATTEIFA